jgi:integrase
MSVYKRGSVYWYKFRFAGQLIRDSARTSSKAVARKAEHARRRDLELAVNRIQRRERMPLFSVAAREWIQSRNGLAVHSLISYQHYVKTLVAHFGSRLVCDIGHRDIAIVQRLRLAEGKSTRLVNYEIGTLRQILKSYGLWAQIADQVKFLRERHDVGRAISFEDEDKLKLAIRQSRSPALLPLFTLSRDTGLRASEARSLQHKDLVLNWCSGVIVSGTLTVPKSKTDAGTGRVVPLSREVCATLTLWLARFPEAGHDSYVFPHYRVGFAGNTREPYLWDTKPGQPIGEWKKAWRDACAAAGVRYRWHDLRHTFISRLAENPSVSEETIKALAGHVSKRIMERYSHIRNEAKIKAIAALERSDLPSDRAQNSAQSGALLKPSLAN